MRIFPLYWTVLLLTVCISMLMPFFFASGGFSLFATYAQNKENLRIAPGLYFIFSNLFICGQEWLSFMNLEKGILSFSFSDTPSHALSTFMVIPQAWSLGLELLFYFLAPCLLWQKPKNFLCISLLLFLASLFCKIALLALDYPYDPWAYRFFPSTLYLFLLGVFTHYCYSKDLLQKLQKKKLFFIVLALLLVLITYYGGLSQYKAILLDQLKSRMAPETLTLFKIVEIFFQCTVPYGIMSLLIGVLFHLTAQNTWDRKLGELSYPLYICHLLVINTLATFIGNSDHLAYLSLAISLLLSAVLNELLQKPIDQYRAKRLTYISYKQGKWKNVLLPPYIAAS